MVYIDNEVKKLAKDIYASMALKFKPDKVKTLLLAESPPQISDNTAVSQIKYFYNVDYINNQRDILLRETAKVILQNNTLAITSKEAKLATLNALKAEGVYLLDAVKYPINKIDKKLRKQAIQAGVPDLMAKITTLQPEKIIIVMKSVYDLVAQALQKAGLPVVGMLIYSPVTPAPQGLDYKTRLKQALEFTKQG